MSIKQSLRYSLSFEQINFPKFYHNISQTDYYYHILQDNNNKVTKSQAISVNSGLKKGRSPNDKRVVFDKNTYDIWWGPKSPNNYLSVNSFNKHKEYALFHLNHKKKLFIFDGYAGWHNNYCIAVRVICENPYHALFMNNMLIRPSKKNLKKFKPTITIYNAGSLQLEDEIIKSNTSINFNFTSYEMVILGTEYAGEMKKGIFTFMHYIMPKHDILSLHSSVNLSKNDPNDITLFFGLSGTGKTTLSSDSNRLLIGDDEHCWCKSGLFNIEGGCYAKCIGLDANKEPEIWNAIQFGTLLENVDIQEDNSVDFNSSRLTQNTRASYPIEYIKNSKIPCITSHPKNIIFLTCDAFGVLPLVSKLTDQQIKYHFISGYTSKIAGTEEGINEPQATFSACYGQAFLAWHPEKYADLLLEKIKNENKKNDYKINVWLVNTGWVGGKYGDENAQRCPLEITRTIINSIHDGTLINEKFNSLSYLDLKYAITCKNIDEKLLNPVLSWKDKPKYFAELQKLNRLFEQNYKNINGY
jgi:phosphoenolpyruvate carboxykinase (ATP)